MAKKKTAKKRAAKKATPAPHLTGLKEYRCGESGDDPKAPPPAIEKLMVKHWGPKARIFPGGAYRNVPKDLAAALINDQAAEG